MPLRVLRSDDVMLGAQDHVFRHSATRDRIAATCLVGAAAAVGVAAWSAAVPVAISALAIASLAGFGLIAFRTYRHSTNARNWLLAWDGTRALIKLRSHLNAETPDDRSRVVELAGTDLSGVRVARCTTTGYGASGVREDGTSTYLELLLSHESPALAEAVKAERERRGRGSTWRHYPVTMPDPRTIRLEWRGRYARIAPSVDAAITILGESLPVLNTEAAAIDLGSSGMPPVNADAERLIRSLAGEGRIMDATVLAVRTYGISQTEARRLVEGLGARSLPFRGQ